MVCHQGQSLSRNASLGWRCLPIASADDLIHLILPYHYRHSLLALSVYMSEGSFLRFQENICILHVRARFLDFPQHCITRGTRNLFCRPLRIYVGGLLLISGEHSHAVHSYPTFRFFALFPLGFMLYQYTYPLHSLPSCPLG